MGSLSSHEILLWSILSKGFQNFLLQNVISIGAGEDLVSEYRSVIFYHCGKPEWVETIKVMILKKFTFLSDYS